MSAQLWKAAEHIAKLNSNNPLMSKSARGFTLVELLVTISIISILSVIGITVYSGIQNRARDTKVSADFDAMYKNIEIARSAEQKTLMQITGSGCSECVGGCRSDPASSGCLNIMITNYARITSAPLPIDPWGRPYFFDENEGEGGGCRQDTIMSAGPNGRYETDDGARDNCVARGDDKIFCIPRSGYTGC